MTTNNKQKFGLMGDEGIEAYVGSKANADLSLWKIVQEGEKSKLERLGESISIRDYSLLQQPTVKETKVDGCAFFDLEMYDNAIAGSREALQQQIIGIVREPEIPNADILVLGAKYGMNSWTTTAYYLSGGKQNDKTNESE